jgi:HEAT repeat protein
VRKQVVSDVTSFYRPAAFEHAQAVLKSEKNPDIVGTALQALTPLGTNVRSTLVHFLNTNSWRQHLMDTAMTIMRAQNDPYYIEPLRTALEQRKFEVGSRTLASGLEALASLSRDEEDKDVTRQFIAGFANDTRQNVKVAALNALGTLRDERAIPILERFTVGQKNTPLRAAAEKAIENIRANRRNTLEAGDVRREVIELQRQNRELRREFDALKKKIDAVTPPVIPAKKK